MFWVTACVLLIVLWVRSYGWASAPILWSFSIELNKYFIVHLLRGGIGASIVQFHSSGAPEASGIAAPFWLLVPLTVALSFASWLPWWSKRFSLRTLLIATTLVAVVLGLVVWAAS